MKLPCKSIQSSIMTWLIILLLLSACAPAPVYYAPAPVDGDTINLLSGTTNWIISQLARPVPPVGVEVLYNSAKELLVISEPFQEGYGFTILDKATMTSLEDPAVAKSLCGNYVNCATWQAFRDWLLANGWVTQIVAFTTTVSQSWYTWAVGAVYIPTEIILPGYEEYKQ